MSKKNISSRHITSIRNLDQSPRISSEQISKIYSDRIITKTSVGEKLQERPKLIRKSFSKSNQELKETEKIWNQREDDSRKQDSSQVLKRNEIDTLVAIAIIFLLFSLAFCLAPNQYYQPKQ